MKILIVNQYFPPDRAATAQLLGQLAIDLSKVESVHVTVICGTPTYAPEGSSFSPDQTSDSLRIRRIPLLPFSRSLLFVRILNYALFLLVAPIQGLVYT